MMRKDHLQLGLSLFVALSIIVTALLTQDTEHENAFIYVMTAWFIVIAIVQVVFRKRVTQR